jgi:hypothetical protein
MNLMRTRFDCKSFSVEVYVFNLTMHINQIPLASIPKPL